MSITMNSLARLSAGRKILLWSLLLGVLAGLYFYLVYLPNSELLERKTQEMGRLEGQVRELRLIAANIKRFQAEAAKLREELKVAMAQLPTTKEIPSLLANVSNLGREAGLEFLLFRPGPEVNREFYAEIPVEIRVKGSYHHVAVFFDKVGRLPRIVNISGVVMEGVREMAGRTEITTSCTATTFKFIEKETAPPAGDRRNEKGAPAKK